MGKKVAKSARKFAASGQLKKTIDARRKHQQVKKKFDRKQQAKGKGGKKSRDGGDEGEGEREGSSKKVKSVDDLLGAGFMDEDDDEEDEDLQAGDSDEDEEVDDEDGDLEDDQSFASIDDLEDGDAHLMELSKLAEKDPEFFKYLQENDRELLDFNPDEEADEDEEMDEDPEDDEEEDPSTQRAPVLTKKELQKWQKALLEQRSLRALRKLLLAFRSAAHMNEEDQVLAWTIDNATVYNKLITTAFKYTPIILEHHVPYKTLANGKFKSPTQTPKLKALQKLVLSYFNNAIHLITQLTDTDMVQMALSETAKIVPYIAVSRKTVKLYSKTCLEVWATAEDRVRIAAILAIRKLATSADESIIDMVFKGTYLTLIRSCKSTSIHTLPSITLMKNSASEIYVFDHATAYQHAFGYIRQLAILLRNSMKVKSKEAYKQVYNWQFVHCVDFWSLVIARACSVEAAAERGGEPSELKPLIYPLVQVTIGAIKLISNSRSYPYHFHLIRSLLHLTRHTHTYVPLTPYILPIITSSISSAKPKASTLRPLDMDTNIRAPQQYVKTRVYEEGIVEEATYLLADYLSTKPVHASVAFPEVVTPVIVMLRRALKVGKASAWKSKEVGMIKGLVERVEESAKWVEKKRSGVGFAPGKVKQVEEWERGVDIEETPLGKFVKVQRKTREKKRKLVEKARDGEDEILED